jgi:hypothetical protein
MGEALIAREFARAGDDPVGIGKMRDVRRVD